MDLTEGAAHEASLLRCDEHRRAVQAAAADDDAVVELLRQAEDRQMRADLAQFRSDEFGKAARIDADRRLLAARSMKDLMLASGGLYRPPSRFRNW